MIFLKCIKYIQKYTHLYNKHFIKNLIQLIFFFNYNKIHTFLGVSYKKIKYTLYFVVIFQSRAVYVLHIPQRQYHGFRTTVIDHQM